jgi:dTDP-4-amino-4,6-dideoxygalactose transaminase
MDVPFLDVGATYRELRVELDEAVARVLSSGWYVLGPEVKAFEAEWSAYCGARHAVGASNGVDALRLVLEALEVGPGDEVVVPAHTFIASWLSITHLGATPVPVDPDPRTRNLDPARLADAVTPRTKAIVAVHLYGLPSDMEAICAFARPRGIPVIEDAAQAHGARLSGVRTGALADAAAWSFYPGKNLGAFGDGGAVTTDDDDLAAKVRRLSNYGSLRKYQHDVLGANNRLDELQAAVLRVKLRQLDAWNDRRCRIAQRYAQSLAAAELVLPVAPPEAEPVWHLYVVESEARDDLQRALATAGIGTGVHYPVPVHGQPAYARLAAEHSWSDERFPVSARLAREVLSLPIGPHLDERSVDRVVEVVVAATGRRG